MNRFNTFHQDVYIYIYTVYLSIYLSIYLYIYIQLGYTSHRGRTYMKFWSLYNFWWFRFRKCIRVALKRVASFLSLAGKERTIQELVDMLRETLGNQFMLGKSCMKKDEHTLNPTIDTILINSAALLKFRLFYLCFSDRTGAESVGTKFLLFPCEIVRIFWEKTQTGWFISLSCLSSVSQKIAPDIPSISWYTPCFDTIFLAGAGWEGPGWPPPNLGAARSKSLTDLGGFAADLTLPRAGRCGKGKN